MEIDKAFWFTVEEGLSAYYGEQIPEDVWAKFCAVRDFFEHMPWSRQAEVAETAQRMFQDLQEENNFFRHLPDS